MAYRARAPRSRSANSSRRSHDRPGSPGEPDTGRSRTGVNGPLRTVTVREMRVAGLSQRPTTVGGFDTGKLLAVKVARAVWEGAVGKGPDKQEPRWRPTSRSVRFGRGSSEKDQLIPRRRPTSLESLVCGASLARLLLPCTPRPSSRDLPVFTQVRSVPRARHPDTGEINSLSLQARDQHRITANPQLSRSGHFRVIR
jgi:hypothetical protein